MLGKPSILKVMLLNVFIKILKIERFCRIYESKLVTT